MATSYEELLIQADDKGLITKEKPLQAHDGLIRGNRVAIRSGMTNAEKACVLAEEIGHYETTYGNILRQDSVLDRRQELRARAYSYELMVPLEDIIHCFLTGDRNLFEIAQRLDVTEEFLQDALRCYERKHGKSIQLGNYLVMFDPLGVLQKF